MNESSMQSPAWTLDQTHEVYNITRWSGGYFDIDTDGRLVVRAPRADRHPGIVLATLAADLLDRGYGLPVLARFGHVLHDRVDTLCEAFAKSIETHAYEGRYTISTSGIQHFACQGTIDTPMFLNTIVLLALCTRVQVIEMQSLLLLLILAVFLPPAVAQEEIYRWQDAQGNIHYGSKPPATVRAESMGTRTQPLTVNPDESVYTWKDEQGHIHYGDHPPPGAGAKSLDTSTSPLSTIRKTEMRAGEQQLLEGTQR